MGKINDTTTYPNTAPALTDHVPGTDVSNTTNDAAGETVTFTLQAIMDLIEANGQFTESNITDLQSYLVNVVEDTTPQLGGQLDVNGNAIGDGTRELLTFTEDASAVNHVNIENEATGSGPIISSTGDDAAVDLNFATKSTGTINMAADVLPSADSTYDIGASGTAFAEGHFDTVYIGGTQFDGTTLADPNADRIGFWDDSAGTFAWLTASTGLDITGTNLTVDTNNRTDTITFVIDGGGSAISTGVAGYLEVPFACTIQQVTMLVDTSSTTTVDIWKDTYANYPPTDADSITASAVPGTSAGLKDQDATLTGWTTSISAGDILGYNVDANDNATKITISLEVLRT